MNCCCGSGGREKTNGRGGSEGKDCEKEEEVKEQRRAWFWPSISDDSGSGDTFRRSYI